MNAMPTESQMYALYTACQVYIPFILGGPSAT